MTQAALAIECLLRRENKHRDFEMLNKMKPVLDFIIEEIKTVNNGRYDKSTISDDETNEELISVFHDAMNKFSSIDFDLIDDEDSLAKLFGQDGYEAIRALSKATISNITTPLKNQLLKR